MGYSIASDICHHLYTFVKTRVTVHARSRPARKMMICLRQCTGTASKTWIIGQNLCAVSSKSSFPGQGVNRTVPRVQLSVKSLVPQITVILHQ
jgi:hypothetical protein